jgi:hypothetical protein
MGEDRTILIGHEGSKRENISIHLCSESKGEGWYDASVHVRCGVWTGAFRAEFRAGELRTFASELEHLYRSLSGCARLDPIEPYLSLTFVGDGKGHIAVAGKAQQQFGLDTYLTFELALDQTDLPTIVRALRRCGPNLISWTTHI